MVAGSEGCLPLFLGIPGHDLPPGPATSPPPTPAQAVVDGKNFTAALTDFGDALRLADSERAAVQGGRGRRT